MQFRRQKIDQEGINLTPLIDVVFLLLIFFMVSTTFSQKSHLQLTLPEASASEQENSPQSIEIVIGADGSYAVEGEGVINKKLASLKLALSRTAAGAYNRPLIITADARAEYQAVVRAMDAAGQLGFVNLSMSTRQLEQNSSPGPE